MDSGSPLYKAIDPNLSAQPLVLLTDVLPLDATISDVITLLNADIARRWISNRLVVVRQNLAEYETEETRNNSWWKTEEKRLQALLMRRF